MLSIQIQDRLACKDQRPKAKDQSLKTNPALNNAGLQQNRKFAGRPSEGLAELFSGLFCVAASRLNSPRLSDAAYTPLLT
jgi:hypothetical protein